MPCVAKHLDKGVLSTTPGNRLAEKTVKGSEKQAAKIGALPVLTVDDAFGPSMVFGMPTLTKEKRSLEMLCG